MADGAVALAGEGGGDDFAIGALRLLREPFEKAGGVPHLAARLGQGLALLGGHGLRQRFGVGEQQGVPFLEDGRALVRGLRAPRRQRLGGRVDGLVDLFGRQVRDLGEQFARGRIVDLEGRRTRDPLARHIGAVKVLESQGRRQTGFGN